MSVYLYWRRAFGPSCTVFVQPECLHSNNGALSKFDVVLAEDGGLTGPSSCCPPENLGGPF